jgi:hypothetical protein
MLPVGNVELLDKLPSQAKNKYRKINIHQFIAVEETIWQ